MIRLANIHDLDRIEEIYNEIHDEIEAGRAVIGWIRGVYPTRKTAEAAIALGDMYVMEIAGQVVSAARINQYQGPEYDNAAWSFSAAPEDVLVLHTLVVSPKLKGMGYGTQFVDYYENEARRRGTFCLRMDTNALNAPARALYKKLGYTEACIIPTEFNGIKNVQLVCLDKMLAPLSVSDLARKMVAFSEGNLHDINHFMKVYSWAKMIGEGEGLDERTQTTLEIAALVHDIACPLCREKYGSTLAKKQEEEGVPLTLAFLEDSGLDAVMIERIAFLVGHHHTLDGVDGIDWQILLEADYIVNADESGYARENMENFAARVFKTKTGREIMREVYGIG